MSNRRGRGNRNKNNNIHIDNDALKNIIIILVLLIVLAVCVMGIIKLLQKNEQSSNKEIVEERASTEEVFKSAVDELTELENYKSDALIRFSAVGSILSGENMIDSGKPYNTIFDDVTQYLNNTDFTLATYETDAREEKQEFAKSIKNCGINYVSLAHNHALDYENEGLRETNAHLNSVGIETIGIEGGTSQDRVKIVEKKNVKIALLAYTYDNKKQGVNIYNEETTKADLNYAEEMADVSIVLMHWGDINTSEITDEQEQQAKFLIDNGADVIIGAHPSVVQKMEIVKNSSGNDCLVAYSLGNLTSELKEEKTKLGMILNFQIFVGQDGKASLYKVDYTPTYMLDNGSEYTENRYKVLDAKFEITKYEAEDSDISKTLYNKIKEAVESLAKIVE